MSDFDELNVGLRWYVAHTYSGYENNVKKSLEKIIRNRGLEKQIVDIKIPVETIVEKSGDTEKVTENKIFPCYVYIKMEMNDITWHAVRNITGVTGFVGPGSRPEPLPDEEVAALDIEEKQVTTSPFKVGDAVTVTQGLFRGLSGIIQEITDDYKDIKVLIKRGRRDMSVELDSASIKLEKQ